MESNMVKPVSMTTTTNSEDCWSSGRSNSINDNGSISNRSCNMVVSYDSPRNNSVDNIGSISTSISNDIVDSINDSCSRGSAASSVYEEIFSTQEVSSTEFSRQNSSEEIFLEYHRLLDKKSALQRDIENAQEELKEQNRVLEEYRKRYGECAFDTSPESDDHVQNARDHEQTSPERGSFDGHNDILVMEDGMIRLTTRNVERTTYEVTDENAIVTKLIKIAVNKYLVETDSTCGIGDELQLANFPVEHADEAIDLIYKKMGINKDINSACNDEKSKSESGDSNEANLISKTPTRDNDYREVKPEMPKSIAEDGRSSSENTENRNSDKDHNNGDRKPSGITGTESRGIEHYHAGKTYSEKSDEGCHNMLHHSDGEIYPEKSDRQRCGSEHCSDGKTYSETAERENLGSKHRSDGNTHLVNSNSESCGSDPCDDNKDYSEKSDKQGCGSDDKSTSLSSNKKMCGPEAYNDDVCYSEISSTNSCVVVSNKDISDAHEAVKDFTRRPGGKCRIPKPVCCARGSARRDASRYQRISRDLYIQRSDYNREDVTPEHERHVMRSNSEYAIREDLVVERQKESSHQANRVIKTHPASRRVNSADRRRKVVRSKIDTGLGKHRPVRQEIRVFANNKNISTKDTRVVSENVARTGPYRRRNVTSKIDTGLKKTKNSMSNTTKHAPPTSTQADKEAHTQRSSRDQLSKYNPLPPIKRAKTSVTDCCETPNTTTTYVKGSAQFTPTPPMKGTPGSKAFARMHQKGGTGKHSPLPPLKTPGSTSPGLGPDRGKPSNARKPTTPIRHANALTPPQGCAQKSTRSTARMRSLNKHSVLPPVKAHGHTNDVNLPAPSAPKPEALWISFSPSPPPNGAPKSRPLARRPKLTSEKCQP